MELDKEVYMDDHYVQGTIEFYRELEKLFYGDEEE